VPVVVRRSSSSTQTGAAAPGGPNRSRRPRRAARVVLTCRDWSFIPPREGIDARPGARIRPPTTPRPDRGTHVSSDRRPSRGAAAQLGASSPSHHCRPEMPPAAAARHPASPCRRGGPGEVQVRRQRRRGAPRGVVERLRERGRPVTLPLRPHRAQKQRQRLGASAQPACPAPGSRSARLHVTDIVRGGSRCLQRPAGVHDADATSWRPDVAGDHADRATGRIARCGTERQRAAPDRRPDEQLRDLTARSSASGTHASEEYGRRRAAHHARKNFAAPVVHPEDRARARPARFSASSSSTRSQPQAPRLGALGDLDSPMGGPRHNRGMIEFCSVDRAAQHLLCPLADFERAEQCG